MLVNVVETVMALATGWLQDTGERTSPKRKFALP